MVRQVPAVERAAETAAPKYKIPKALAAVADRFYEVRTQRYAADKVAEALKAEEYALREHLINNLPKSEATGVAGRLCRVAVVTKTTYQVADWDEVYAYVVKNHKKGAFALLQRRLSEPAAREIFEKGGKLAGVVPYSYPELSVNKL